MLTRGNLVALHYGDDYPVLGSRRGASEFREDLLKHFLLRSRGVLVRDPPSAGDMGETSYLGRIVRRTDKKHCPNNSGMERRGVNIQPVGPVEACWDPCGVPLPDVVGTKAWRCACSTWHKIDRNCSTQLRSWRVPCQNPRSEVSLRSSGCADSCWALDVAHGHFPDRKHRQRCETTATQTGLVAHVNRTPTRTACTHAHSVSAHTLNTMITFHHANTRGSSLKIAHLCVPKTSVIHVSCLIPCRT